MSKEEDLFKQHLDDMLSSQQFEMGADNWSGMEQLLNQQQRKRRGFFILFSGLGVLLLGTLAWLLMPAINQTATEVASRSTTDVPTATINTSPNAIVPATTAAAPKTVKPSNTSTAPKTKDIPSTDKTSTSGAIKPAINPTKVVKPANAQPALPAEPVKMVDGTTPAAAQTVSDNHPSSTNQNTAPLPPANSQPAAPAKENANNIPAVSTNGISLSGAPNTSTLVASPAAAETPVSTVLSNSITAISNTNETATPAKDSIAVKPLVKVDTLPVTPIAAKPDTDYVAKKHFRFALEGGFTALSGWKVNETRDAAGVNPLAGAHFIYPLSSELDVSLGLQYTTVGNLQSDKYTATVSRLDLGRVEQSTVFTPIRLHYVVMPLKFMLHLNSRQSIGAGLNVAYLLTSDTRVETFTYGYNSSARTSSQIKKGYTQGFNNIDAQVAAYFNYELSKKFDAQACLMYGLMDVKTGEVLPSKGVERNTGAKISIFYSLFEK